MAEPSVLILGAGPAGLGAAYKLRQSGRAIVTVAEQATRVGGLAGSFEIAGQRVDFGSHRLHPSCNEDVLRDIRSLLGDALLDRPRHGRIRLRDRWIHFPLQPLDLLVHLDPPFALGTLADRLRRRAYTDGGRESFASVLWQSLGPTICREFYFPYARKIWGLDPDSLSPIQARRRVSAASFTKLIRKVLSAVPGLRPPGAGRFFYPRNGFGQICEAYAGAATKSGARLMLGWRIEQLELDTVRDRAWRAVATDGSSTIELEADYVWSTVPVPVLSRLIRPGPPAAVTAAAASIEYRAMILIYLTLDTDRFTEFDAHYFPSEDIAITRLSEPKNYADRRDPRGQTVLCAELPCTPDDERWIMHDADLGRLVAADLERAGVPLLAAVDRVDVRRLRYAYPIYQHGYEAHFGVLDRWVDSVPHFLSYGRQGLFAHDNTHHALFMAYAAVDCLVDGHFDRERWQAYRDVFANHVVED